MEHSETSVAIPMSKTSKFSSDSYDPANFHQSLIGSTNREFEQSNNQTNQSKDSEDTTRDPLSLKTDILDNIELEGGDDSWIKHTKDPFAGTNLDDSRGNEDIDIAKKNDPEAAFDQLREKLNDEELIETQGLSATQKIDSFSPVKFNSIGDKSYIKFTFDQTQPKFTQTKFTPSQLSHIIQSERGSQRSDKSYVDTQRIGTPTQQFTMPNVYDTPDQNYEKEYADTQKIDTQRIGTLQLNVEKTRNVSELQSQGIDTQRLPILKEDLAETQKIGNSQSSDTSFKDKLYQSQSSENQIQIPGTLEANEERKELQSEDIVYTNSQKSVASNDKTDATVNQLPDIIANDETNEISAVVVVPDTQFDEVDSSRSSPVLAESSPAKNEAPTVLPEMLVDVPLKRKLDRNSRSISPPSPQKRKKLAKINISKSETSTKEEEQTLVPPKYSKTCSAWILHDFCYYPSKIMKRVNNLFETRIYDTTVNIPKKSIISPLDIKVGDLVLYRAEKTPFVVTKLDYLPTQKSSFQGIYSVEKFNTVHLKKWSKKGIRKNAKEVTADISDIYMTEELWLKREVLADSKFIIETVEGEQIVDILDGSIITQRARPLGRLNLRSKLESNPKDLISYMSSPDPSPRKPETTIFKNTVFCLTGIENGRTDLINLVRENGGFLLHDGFESMLNIETNKDGNIIGFDIKNEFKAVKFAAVIAPNYARSSKYLQALALGWPILSTKFVKDCVANRSWLTNWYSYRLAAGESKVLDCVQSIDLDNFRENYAGSDATISDQLSNNKHVLKDTIVFAAHNHPEISELLFASLGAKVVAIEYSRELNQEVKQHLEVKNQKFFFYDDLNIAKIKEKLKISDPSRLRRVKSEPQNDFSRQELLVKRPFTRNDKRSIQVGIIDWEWLVQCVISLNCWPAEDKIILQV